jgi:hypothetical protein
MSTTRTGTAALLRISWFAIALLVAACGGTNPVNSETTIAPTTTPSLTTPMATTTEATPTPTPKAIPKPTPRATPKPAPRTTVRTPKPAPPTTSAAPVRNCDPAYPDVCLHDGIGDYDCAGGSGNGPNYVEGPIRVVPPDPFGLDRDADGTGCE